MYKNNRKGEICMDVMDVASMSMMQAQQNVMQAMNIKLMDNVLEQSEANSAALTKMMESSVTPNLGQSIDIRL